MPQDFHFKTQLQSDTFINHSDVLFDVLFASKNSQHPIAQERQIESEAKAWILLMIAAWFVYISQLTSWEILFHSIHFYCHLVLCNCLIICLKDHSNWGLTCWAFGQQRKREIFFLAGNSWEVSGHFVFITDKLVLIYEDIEINTNLAIKMTQQKNSLMLCQQNIPYLKTHAINISKISRCPHRGSPKIFLRY